MHNSVTQTTPVLEQFVLEPDDSQFLAQLCGQYDCHLRQIEARLDVRLHNRGNRFKVSGVPTAVLRTKTLLKKLYLQACNGTNISPELIHLQLQQSSLETLTETPVQETNNEVTIKTRKVFVRPRGKNQKLYVNAIKANDINFGIGPAGTGKTYLAVACAVEALETDRADRILLVRPAVEAGEKLGFLPGDLAQKIDPYLRPLYDALYEMMGFEYVSKLIERNIIEIAPLAYMRGRTLNNAYIILDESQNTTREQMKMFLTRIGFGSTAVITGDITQIDLPKGTPSGLKHAMSVLDKVNGISITQFASKDVVRHPLVQRIVEAYTQAEESQQNA